MRQSIFILRKLSRCGLLCLVFVVWFCLLSQFSYAANQVSPPSVSSSSTVPPRLDSVVVTATRSEAKTTVVLFTARTGVPCNEEHSRPRLYRGSWRRHLQARDSAARSRRNAAAVLAAGVQPRGLVQTRCILRVKTKRGL